MGFFPQACASKLKFYLVYVRNQLLRSLSNEGPPIFTPKCHKEFRVQNGSSSRSLPYILTLSLRIETFYNRCKKIKTMKNEYFLSSKVAQNTPSCKALNEPMKDRSRRMLSGKGAIFRSDK